jgi:type I restriction enzyme S subunit
VGAERRTARLGELCELRAGVAFPLQFQGCPVGEFPFIKVSDMSRSGNELLIARAEHWVDAAAAAAMRARPVPAASVVFARIGEAIRQNRKRMTTRPTLLDNNMMAAVPREGVDPWFLHYLFCTLDLEGLIEGTALPYLKASVLEQVEVELPPLATQRRIAEVLGLLDERIELTRRLNRTLEALSSTLFRSRLLVTEGGALPKGWRWGTIGDVARQVREIARPSGMAGSTPYIGLEHMPQRSLALAQWATAAGLQSQKFRFRQGHILFGKLRPYFHKVGIAPVDGVCSTDIVVVEPLEPAFFSLVLGHLSSVEFVGFTDSGSDGTRMPRTSWKRMACYPIALPDARSAEELNRLTRPLLDKLLANIHACRALAQLRECLLPRLISGELEAPSQGGLPEARPDMAEPIQVA